MATRTRKFGAGGREGHDASPFYERKLREVEEHRSREAVISPVRNKLFAKSSETMAELPDDCVALMVTSPPYHVGKDYDSDVTFDEYLKLLSNVFRETYRVLEPGGRAVVNVANLGRRPYISLAGLVAEIMDDIGFLPRGEVIWAKGKGASGSCAWGSWQSANNPTFRDLHEYCLCFSKERYDRAFKGESTITRDEFLQATLSIWEIPAESASRVGHPAPFPVALPRRFIELYTYLGDLVLDPFAGSGSTALAAATTGRDYVGYEIDEDYIRIAENRLSEFGLAKSLPQKRPRSASKKAV